MVFFFAWSRPRNLQISLLTSFYTGGYCTFSDCKLNEESDGDIYILVHSLLWALIDFSVLMPSIYVPFSCLWLSQNIPFYEVRWNIKTTSFCSTKTGGQVRAKNAFMSNLPWYLLIRIKPKTKYKTRIIMQIYFCKLNSFKKYMLFCINITALKAWVIKYR